MPIFIYIYLNFKNVVIKKHLPNFITLLNLFCGSVAVMFAVTDQFENAAIFVLLGIFFDFFDGLAARLLNVQSNFGLELDSLADMVTSGLVPGIIMFKLLGKSVHSDSFAPNFIEKSVSTSMEWAGIQFSSVDLIPFLGLILTMAAAYRLAKFNLDDRQTDAFIGMPVPAMALFILSLPLIQVYSENDAVQFWLSNRYVLIAIILVLSYLMNSELRLFSLKFKNGFQKESILPIVFVLISIILLVWINLLAIPMIILIYVISSVVNNALLKS